jgi:hypothetical protein
MKKFTLDSFKKYRIDDDTYCGIPVEYLDIFRKLLVKPSRYKYNYHGYRRGGVAKGTISKLKWDAIYFNVARRGDVK